ncbi:MAG: phosphoribosylformylglycinamidine synthase [Candidatus Melainabacteria bacterium]|nr:phosphoribosylformylglycinamidine synthase [Candidatus Melainabacteria bacterium]
MDRAFVEEKQFLACVAARRGKRQHLPVYWLAFPKDAAVLADSASLAKVEALLRELVCDTVDEEFYFTALPVVSSSNDKATNNAGESFALMQKLKADGFTTASIKHFKSGVTDNTANSCASALHIMGLDCQFRIGSGFIFAGLAPEAVPHNNLTERVLALDLEQPESLPLLPRRQLEEAGGFEYVSLAGDDDYLEKLSKERLLSLTLDEMKAVQELYLDESFRAHRQSLGLELAPTDVELEVIAQTWSEHCKHKIFSAIVDHSQFDENDELVKRETIDSLYKTYIKGATAKLKPVRPDLLSVFEDNAGVVAFDAENAVCFKVETHNSPSALEPYGGALTGILGVNRDILGTGLGAKPIFNTDVFCLPHPDSPFVKDLKHDKLLPARDLARGVRQGVQDGGNKSGIPTVNGAVFFDDSYRAKPLIYCGTGGLLPLQAAGRDAVKKHTTVGDAVVMAGGRVGRDGVHGATFSSLALDDSMGSDVVQIGDPFTQKRLTDLVLQARDAGLITGLTDNGAGGLSSSVGEMATLTNGAELVLDAVPLKYPGLKDWQIVVSESQERMTFSTDKPEELLALAARLDVEATVIGRFTDDGYFRILREGKVVALLPLSFLHGGAPRLKLTSQWRKEAKLVSLKAACRSELSLKQIVEGLLSHANICSRESIVRQYDHEVQGGSVVKPLMGNSQKSPCDAGVVKPLAESKKAVAVANGLAPRLSKYDPALMAQVSADEAVRSVVAVGADPATVTLLDNFCWPDPVTSLRNPQGARKMAQLVLACQGLYKLCLAYKSPLISGKDSMKNDFDDGNLRLSVLPTLLMSSMAFLPDFQFAVTSDFKESGALIYWLKAGRPALTASHAAELAFQDGAAPEDDLPYFDLDLTIESYRCLHQAMLKGLVDSAHDLGDGGLAVTLLESAMGGDLAFEVSLNVADDWQALQQLCGEGSGMLVLTVKPEKQSEFERCFTALNLQSTVLHYLGKVLAKDKPCRFTLAESSFEIDLQHASSLYNRSLPFDDEVLYVG